MIVSIKKKAKPQLFVRECMKKIKGLIQEN